MLRVYLAAPYVQKEQMKIYANQLKGLNVVVTSSWLQEPHKPSTQMHELSHEEHLGYAKQDIKDIFAADAMIFFTDPTQTIVRAGRHVEFGMVLAMNFMTAKKRPIFVVGSDFENIFHHMPNVYHFDEWELALDAVTRYSLNNNL